MSTDTSTETTVDVVLVLGQDRAGFAKFGIVHDGAFIDDPFRSACGNYGVDPAETYGVPTETAQEIRRLNNTIASSTAVAARATEQAIAASMSDGKDFSTGLFDTATDLRASLSGPVAACLAHALHKRGVTLSVWDPHAR